MASNAQNHYIIPIGEGSATSPNAPAYAYYNYSISQMLYTANQIGIDGNIDTIAFTVASGFPSTMVFSPCAWK